jgi:F0F1-type ATP synthase membrane subunit b/b'
MPETQVAIKGNVDKPLVEIDTSAGEVDVQLPEKKSEQDVEIKDDQTATTVDPQPKKDELDQVSDAVQKRIDRLTWKVREAERREKTATEYAKNVQTQLQEQKTRVTKLDDGYVNEFKNRVESQITTAKDQLKLAINAGDAEKQAEAQAVMARLAADQQRLAQLEATKPKAVADGGAVQATVPAVPQPPVNYMGQPVPRPDPKAQSWAQKNAWFGKDDAMTYTAYSMHRKLVEQEGFDANSDEYYNEIDTRMRKEFPHKFEDQTTGTDRPVQAVASASRTSSKPGRKTVRLSSSQVAIAKKLGVPLQEYAKYVKE